MASASIGVIILILIVIVLAIVGYFETGGFKLNKSISVTPPPAPKHVSKPDVNNSTNYLYGCDNYDLQANAGSTSIGACTWSGGTLGVWVSTGKMGFVNFSIVGSNNKTYVKQEYLPYSCSTFYTEFYAPAQIYYLTLGASNSTTNGPCLNNYSIVTLNTSVKVLVNKTYYSFYQGNLSTGTYIGWSTSGTAFGGLPLNLTYANDVGCYPKDPWENYSGIYYISSYNCSPIESTGNITSSRFLIDKPFLNLQIISPKNSLDYLEIIPSNASTPYITDQVSTYSLSLSNGSLIGQGYKLENATIPLTSLLGKVVRLRIVQESDQKYEYMIAGDIRMSDYPDQGTGFLDNITYEK